MGKTIGYVLAAIIATIALVYALTWIGLVGQRPIARYQEETRAQTYDTSRAYAQGTNRDIAQYCEKMRTTKETSGKKAVAALIRSTASTYDGQLSADNEDCLNEAKGM